MNEYDKIINDNIGFIKKIANKYCYNNDMFEDYFQEACLQTIKIYNKFDKSKGNKFITYLYVSLPRRMARVKRTRKLDSLVYLPDRVGKEVGNDKNAYSVSLTDDYLFIDLIKADNNTPDKILENKTDILKDDLFIKLNDKEKELLKMKFGLGNYEQLSIDEIATVLNCSPMTVYRKTEKIYKKLRRRIDGKKNKEN